MATSLPTIKITGPENWEKVDQALMIIDRFDWIVFSSPNGARYFIERSKRKNIDLNNVKIAVVGKKTATEVEKCDLKVTLVPEKFSAKDLLSTFDTINIQNKEILLPSSDLSRDELMKGLKDQGASVTRLITYRTLRQNEFGKEKIIINLFKDPVDCVTFFSPSAFHSFIDQLDAGSITKLSKSTIAIAAIGPTTAKAIENKGLKVSILPAESQEDSLIGALIDYYRM